MNITIVNHADPETQHVSGMRAWFFANQLATMGHRVVEICEARGDKTSRSFEAPVAMMHSLADHDWRLPFLLAVRAEHDRLSYWIRSTRTPAVIRKSLVAYSFLGRGGVYSDFSRAVIPYLAHLAREFKPDIVWGIYLDSDCWLISQRLARLAGCPWVGDMKDSWDAFVPLPLRGLLALRFRNMAACTANSEFNARVLEHRFRRSPTVVYSGVDGAFTDFDSRESGTLPTNFRLTVTGGLYSGANVDRFVSGLRRWLATASKGPSGAQLSEIEIFYAGANCAVAEAKLGSLRDVARVHVHGYLPLPQLAALCRSATANAYMWCPSGFHHKLLELLACGRPVIAFPGESDESRRLADRCRGDLRCPVDEEKLADTLEELRVNCPASASGQATSPEFSWAAQARMLESVLARTVAECAGKR